MLNSPEAIKECVEAYLEVHGDPPHCPFWWREWNEDDEGKIRKKVRSSFQHYIKYVLTRTLNYDSAFEGDVSEFPYHVHACAHPFCRVWK